MIKSDGPPPPVGHIEAARLRSAGFLPVPIEEMTLEQAKEAINELGSELASARQGIEDMADLKRSFEELRKEIKPPLFHDYPQEVLDIFNEQDRRRREAGAVPHSWYVPPEPPTPIDEKARKRILKSMKAFIRSRSE